MIFTVEVSECKNSSEIMIGDNILVWKPYCPMIFFSRSAFWQNLFHAHPFGLYSCLFCIYLTLLTSNFRLSFVFPHFLSIFLFFSSPFSNFSSEDTGQYPPSPERREGIFSNIHTCIVVMYHDITQGSKCVWDFLPNKSRSVAKN